MGPATPSSTSPVFSPAINSGSEDSQWAASPKEPGFHSPGPWSSPQGYEEDPQLPTMASAEFPIWVSCFSQKYVLKPSGDNCASFTLRKMQGWFFWKWIHLILLGTFALFCLLVFTCLDNSISSHMRVVYLGEELALMQAENAHQVCVSESTAQRCRGALYNTQEGRLFNQPLSEWGWM